MGEYVLECENLVKYYGDKPALNSFNLQLGRGKIVGILGPNGSGKTTLMKIISGLLAPNCGSVTVSGNVIGTETKKLVSYLPDRDYLPDNVKIKALINLFEDFYKDFDSDRARIMIESLGITVEDTLKKLSKGTREKVQLILVMCRKADLYVLDEPIGGVDPVTRDYILENIINSYSPDSTVLIATHLISDVEKILDEIVFVKDGTVVLHSDVDSLREERGKSALEMFREVFSC